MNTFFGRFRIDLLLLVVAATWGSTYLATKELVTPATVIALLSLRMLLAAGIMTIVVMVRQVQRGDRSRSLRSELSIGVILGVLLAAVFICETFGVAHTSATNAGLIISLTMVFTPILESVIARQRLPVSFFLASLIAVVGVALLAGVGAFQTPSLGDVLVLGAAVIRTIHVVTMHRLTEGRKRSKVISQRQLSNAPLDTLVLTTVQLATCAVLFTLASSFFGTPVLVYLATFDGAKLALFAYLVVVCTVFAFFVQMWAVRRTSPARVSLLLGTEPLWATVVGVGIARDGLDLAGWCGVGLVLAGIFWGRRIEQRHREGIVQGTAQSELLPSETPGRLS